MAVFHGIAYVSTGWQIFAIEDRGLREIAMPEVIDLVDPYLPGLKACEDSLWAFGGKMTFLTWDLETWHRVVV